MVLIPSGLRFVYLWSDSDLFKLRVSASNGRFAGTADLYVEIGGFAEAAETIAGFPRTTSDERELQFGEFGPKAAGGAIKVRFYCVGLSGRSLVEIKLESDYQPGPVETVQLTIPVEAGAVDSFVRELKSLEANHEGAAQLLCVVSSD